VGQNTNAGRKRLLEMFHFLQKKKIQIVDETI